MVDMRLATVALVMVLIGGDALAAKLIFREDFEDGKIDAPLALDAGSAAKIVSSGDGATVFAGQRCLRGNFKVGYVDPITKQAATSRYTGLELALGGATRFYLSVRYRLDPGNQWIMDDASSTALGYKFFYLMGTPWNNTLNWVLAQLWGPTHWWMGDNQPQNSTSYAKNVTTPAPHGQLGAWHHIEIYAELNSAPGAKDGKLLLRIDGATQLSLSDVPYQTSTAQKFGSLGGVPHMYGGCCGAKNSFGWQIDDLELWDDLPANAPSKDGGTLRDGQVAPTRDLAPSEPTTQGDRAAIAEGAPPPARFADEATRPVPGEGCGCSTVPGAGEGTLVVVGAALGLWLAGRRRATARWCGRRTDS